jgi:hypothetical protein
VTAIAKLNPVQARKKVKAFLIEKYALDARSAEEIALWDIPTAERLGWYGGGSKGQVAWEGGPYEWAIELSEDVAAGRLDLGPYYLECSTSWCVALYPK